MKNKKISQKLFRITFLFFIAFTTIILLVQLIFFKRFYVLTKEKFIAKNSYSIKEEYNLLKSHKATNTEIDKSVYMYESSNTTFVCVFDSKFNIEFQSSLLVRRFGGYGIAALHEECKKHFLDIMNVNNQNPNRYTTFRFRDLGNVKTEYFVILTPYTNYETKENTYFAILHPMQPVGDVMMISKEYYVYIYIAGIFVIVLISTIYSSMISTPLVRLNKSASKMARLDFSEKCRVDSKDELGELAGTLNFLSENLDNTLSELKLANEKLTDDIEKERELERMRREFVADVSHELKTPVALIKGYAEGIKDGIAEGEKREHYLEIIIDETDKMSALVNDMLNLSKMEAGKMTLDLEEFKIDRLVRKVVQKHNEAAARRDILVEIVSQSDISVTGDEFRIEEVLTNYFTNAVNHTDRYNKIWVRIIESDNQARVEVENQGEHIPEEELPRIWEKFYRIEKSRNRSLGGTGLGLAISKNILTLHHSNFGAYNTHGGVCFYFTLEKHELNCS